jgi:hypothetical protein
MNTRSHPPTPLRLQRETLRRLPYQPPSMANLGRMVDLIQGTGVGGPDAFVGERIPPP